MAAVVDVPGVSPVRCAAAVPLSLDRHIMQTPKAHMTRHGSVLSRMGARPAATSQLQFKASPAVIAMAARPSRTRGLPR
jgi:hypothetical protein